MKSTIDRLVLGASLATASLAHAAVVAQYNFNSAADPLVVTSSDLDAGSTAGNISAGAGANLGRGTSDLFPVNGLSYLGVTTKVDITTLAQAVSNDVSFSFTRLPNLPFLP